MRKKKDKMVFYDTHEDLRDDDSIAIQKLENYQQPFQKFTILNPDAGSSYSFK